MFSRSESFQRALSEVEPGFVLQENDAIELSNGWYFPLRRIEGDDENWFGGSHGLAVHKQKGNVMHFGSAFSRERDLRAYEAGMTRWFFDILINGIHDHQATLDFVQSFGQQIVEPEFDGETTWRIPRQLRRVELELMLGQLPCRFQRVGVYGIFEGILAAQAGGCCDFELLDPGLPDAIC